jgi:hypothetical protein
VAKVILVSCYVELYRKKGANLCDEKKMAAAKDEYGPVRWERERAAWLSQRNDGDAAALGQRRVLGSAQFTAASLASCEPFSQPVPLSSLVKHLVAEWTSLGLFAGMEHEQATSGESGSGGPTPASRARSPATLATLPGPRRRGRPPGSKNKPKVAVPQPALAAVGGSPAHDADAVLLEDVLASLAVRQALPTVKPPRRAPRRSKPAQTAAVCSACCRCL